MSFIEGIFTYDIELSDVDRNLYASLKVRSARHELVSLEQYYGRIMAYCVSYRQGLTLSNDATETKCPDLLCGHVDTTLDYAGFVGECDAKKLRHYTKRYAPASCGVFFYNKRQVYQFCQTLKGAKENWVKQITFSRFDSNFLLDLSTFEDRRNEWSVMIVDGTTIFVTINEETFESELETLSIWEEYQTVIKTDLPDYLTR